jgi:hypothetical protein
MLWRWVLVLLSLPSTSMLVCVSTVAGNLLTRNLAKAAELLKASQRDIPPAQRQTRFFSPRTL